jgi:hypothetical protein
MTKMSETQPNSRGHDLAGELYDGHLLVHELFGQAPHDASRLWLVEDLRTGQPELWRSCDLTRITRTGQKTNKTRHGGFRAYATPKVCEQTRWYDDALKSARQRFEEIKAAEPPHLCVVITDTDETGTVTERCSRTATRRHYQTAGDGTMREIWYCENHAGLMTKGGWHKRTYY